MQAILASALWQKCVARLSGRRLIAGGALLLAMAAAGCSTIDFAYSMAPTALGLMADNYLDLDGEQEGMLKERLLTLREWTRTTQMAEYSRFLNEVRARAAGKVTLDDVEWLTREGRRHWKTLGERLAVDMAELAPRLTADNLAALQRKLARNNAEYSKDYLDATLEKQRERRFERVKENFARWYGDFDDTQLTRIKALSDALPMNPRMVLEDRVRRQNAMAAVLAGLADKSLARAVGEQRLAVMLTDFERSRTPAYQALAAAYVAQSQALTVAVANLATPSQRDTAQRRFKRWMDDMANLAARKEP